jgi:DNA modification methylase
MQIETLQIKDLILYEKNARTHPKKQIDLLVKNIERFGFTTPCLIDKHSNVIAGHGRIEAMKKLGRDEIPCVRLENLSEEEVNALRIADNKLSEMSEWDMSLVLEELKDLSDEMFDLTGFDKDLILEPEEEDDVIPEAPEEPKSELGDVYELGKHRVLCGDSAKVDDLEKLMNGHKADMVFTDPPWNVNYGDTSKDNAQGYKPRTIMNDNMGEDFIPFLMDVFAMTSLYSKGGSPTYVVMSAQEWGGMMKVMQDNGYHWSSTIIWKKDRLVMSRKDYHTQYEPIWYGWKDGSRLKPVEDRKQSDVWEVKRPSDSPLHPTTKPVELVERAIINSSKNEDIILEQFCGSGSTLIASEKTNRICYGMELDPKYVDVIVQRYVDYTGNENIKLNGKEITWTKTPTKTPTND